jgi:glutamate 5-kinase
MMMQTKNRTQLGQTQRWVIKIGSAMITNDGRGLDLERISAWAGQMAALHRQGKELLLVSSGAVAEGMRRLGQKQRPAALHALQAAAAVGQMGLVQAYESQFQNYGIRTAQVLLTHDDASDRKRYLNIRSTLRTLLQLGVIPVINENDTVAYDEIRFGDNDTLGALVANLVEADLLVILTDQRGMYERDPRLYPDAKLIEQAEAGDPALEMMSGAGGNLGRGGMLTKVRAAAKAARSGASSLIVWGQEPDVLLGIAQGKALGTLFRPSKTPLAARKQWLAAQLQVRGQLYLDAGAAQVLTESGRSLLPVGVSRIEGTFLRGELVACVAPNGQEIARGLVNYSAADSAKLIGQPSEKIADLLGYVDEPELIHRDNLVLL